MQRVPVDSQAGGGLRVTPRAMAELLHRQVDPDIDKSGCVVVKKRKNQTKGPAGHEEAGQPSRVVHLAPGTYAVGALNLAHRLSLVGTGSAETVIEGTVEGLRTEARLFSVTLTSGTRGGVRVSHGESPEIADSRSFSCRMKLPSIFK